MSDTGEPIKYFERSETIYPKRVWGLYRQVKWISMVVLLGIYYLAPFLRWDRGANVPDQAILIDMPARRLYFFMFELWPQEIYALTGVLILAAVGLFFATSLFGRVWCGYACPQTVWTDLFVWVERLVQGDRTKRMRLAKAPWSVEKLAKYGLTHFIWIVIAFLTGGAWVLYFNDAPTLIEDALAFDVSWSVMVWVIGLTFSTWFMAGLTREQVCTYYCPYSRFQSAMFDDDSMVVSYDAARGESRGKHKKGESWDDRGHCIDCRQCVEVCPMGIDIRDGLQLECIACGLCVDACNNIMDKLDLKRGLVRYDTVNNQQARAEGRPERSNILRPRTIYYTIIMTVVGALTLYGLLARDLHEMHVDKDRNPQFVKLSDGRFRNGYDLRILNKTHNEQKYHIAVKGLEGAELRVRAAGGVTPEAMPVFADSVGQFHLFVTANGGKPRENFTLVLMQADGTVVEEVETHFTGGNAR